MRDGGKKRQVARTVLLVGEGDSEVVWLQHLKSIYITRGCGVAVTIKNARGKGAAHVVDVAVRQSRNAAFDVKAALLDTDTDWNDKTRAAARKARVLVVEAAPCLEGLLLSVHEQPVRHAGSANLKQAFLAYFGACALDPKVYERHFQQPVLEKAAVRLAPLKQLLDLFLK